jgi:hypothetical protein
MALRDLTSGEREVVEQVLRATSKIVCDPGQLRRENERLKAEIADLRETVLWCQRRLPPSMQPYVARMLAGDYVVPGTSE